MVKIQARKVLILKDAKEFLFFSEHFGSVLCSTQLHIEYLSSFFRWSKAARV
jgi:hypothetical protein